VLGWLRSVHETTAWTTSACTGSLLLAAGLLKDAPATTHWVMRETLGELGAVPVRDGVVEHGKIMTAAGVSSGLDMALQLVQRIHGDEAAHAVQLGIEYHLEPPFDAGAPEKVPQPIADAVDTVFRSRAAEVSEQERPAGTEGGSGTPVRLRAERARDAIPRLIEGRPASSRATSSAGPDLYAARSSRRACRSPRAERGVCDEFWGSARSVDVDATESNGAWTTTAEGRRRVATVLDTSVSPVQAAAEEAR
jgi:hypothetical protein